MKRFSGIFDSINVDMVKEAVARHQIGMGGRQRLFVLIIIWMIIVILSIVIY